MSLILYTQPRCGYCDVMKNKLDLMREKYYTIDITEDPGALALMKANGHKTVPQLYWNDIHLNKKDTSVIKTEDIYHALTEARQSEWDISDSGIDHYV